MFRSDSNVEEPGLLYPETVPYQQHTRGSQTHRCTNCMGLICAFADFLRISPILVPIYIYIVIKSLITQFHRTPCYKSYKIKKEQSKRWLEESYFMFKALK